MALLITESFHLFFVASALYVWLVSGIWTYAVAAAVAVLPVGTYAIRSMIHSRSSEG
jgi:hypothetical protein